MLRMIMAALALSASSSLAQSPILDPLLPREDQTPEQKSVREIKRQQLEDLAKRAAEAELQAREDERLQQIKLLEQKIRQLSEEAERLRLEKAEKSVAVQKALFWLEKQQAPEKPETKPASDGKKPEIKFFEMKLKGFQLQSAPGPQPIALSRATYDLPKGKAEALDALLKEFKVPVMETRIDGNKLTVTTSPEAQKTVAQFVALMTRTQQPMSIRILLDKSKSLEKR